MTDWLSLTGGLRYTQERRSLSRLVTIPQALDPLVPVLTDFSKSDTFDAWTPMASVTFNTLEDWLDHTGALDLDWVMPYFLYSRGFKGGGINGAGRGENPIETMSFQPEFANFYEWGIKTIGFGRRLRVDFDYVVMDLEVVNFRLSYDFNDDQSQIAFWSKNMADEEYFTNALAWPRLTGSVVRYYDAPSTSGVELSQRF